MSRLELIRRAWAKWLYANGASVSEVADALAVTQVRALRILEEL